MPAYPYRCSCGHTEDVIKPMRDYDAPEICRVCHQVMGKDYGSKDWASIGAAVFKGHYNESLGRYIGSHGDIRDAQSRIRDETGSRPIEIGNERPKVAPEKKDVDMREVIAYAEKLQTDRGEAVNAG
jgi:predicted nucleic acid-binding Zn ribbon protein